MIRREDGRFCLYTKDGSRKLGCHDTRAQAEAQERAIMQREAQRAAQIRKKDGKYCHDLPDGGEMCHDTREQAEAHMRRIRNGQARRDLHLLVSPASLRTAKFEEREHLVVPVVALVEGVIHASNAAKPELVTLEALSKAPQGWNGRPVVPGHPLESGAQISANTPAILEKRAIGRVFNSEIKGKALELEAWIDVERAEKLGGEALEALERVRSGGVVEVSVGAFVVTEKRAGSWNGQPFFEVWTEIVPDHLALLRESETGACSVDMGCGAPRAARRYAIRSGRFESEGGPSGAGTTAGEGEGTFGAGGAMSKTLRERISAFAALFRSKEEIRAAQEEGSSDNELRQKLGEALFAEEPGFMGIEAVYPDATEVVYAVAPEGELKYFKRTYTLAEGAVTLGEATEVRPITKFEIAASGCGCGGMGQSAAGEGSGMTATKKDLIDKVLRRKDKLFVESDTKVLESFCEERLKALAEEPVAQEPPVAPPPKEPVAPVEAKTKTPEEERAEFLAKFPDVKAVLDAHASQRAARHAELLTAIQATKQDAYTQDELKAMPLEQLEKTVKLLAAAKPKTDFSGLGVPRAAAQGQDGPPIASHDALRDMILRNRGLKTA